MPLQTELLYPLCLILLAEHEKVLACLPPLAVESWPHLLHIKDQRREKRVQRGGKRGVATRQSLFKIHAKQDSGPCMTAGKSVQVQSNILNRQWPYLTCNPMMSSNLEKFHYQTKTNHARTVKVKSIKGSLK